MGQAIGKQLAGIPVGVSTQVSKARPKGTGTWLTYVLCGNFQQSVIARVGAIEVVSSTDAGFDTESTWVRGTIRLDFGLAHAESFVLCDQLLMP
jgi:HK97 family phage major capsid protein